MLPRVLANWSFIYVLEIVLLAAFFSTSCSEEISIYGNGKPMPVVYSLLDLAQETQFVRVGYSYQVDNQSSLIPPTLNPDQWKDSLVIYMEEWDSINPVNVLYFKYSPQIVRNDGWFPSGFSRIYSCDFKPKPATRYQLYVYFPDLDEVISAETVTISLPELLDPETVPGRKITFHPETPFVLRYNSFDKQGTFQTVFRLNFTEEHDSSLTFTSADFVSQVFIETKPMEPAQHPINGNEFFKAMAQHIQSESGVIRKVLSMECIFNSAGPEIGLVLDPNKNDMGTAGIAYSYSNLSSGAGVFSSRYIMRLTDIQVSEITIDSLADGQYTRQLNFLDHKGK